MNSFKASEKKFFLSLISKINIFFIKLFSDIAQLIISYLLFILTLNFSQLKHPLRIGILLLIQTFIIAILTGLITKTFWFSYILFLIFIGGILILFIYVSSLASNETFKFSQNLLIFIILILLILLILIIIYDKINFNIILNNLEIKQFKIFLFNNENTINLNKLYNYPSNLITIILINYLFLTLIAAVKITNIFKGPLRQKI